MSYLYAIGAYEQNPIFQINKHIGNDEDVVDNDGKVVYKGDGWGIDGLAFSREVFEIDLKNPKLITFYTNSTGGDVRHAFDMFNAISNAKSKTKSVIAGFCLSSAGWLALAADIVEVYDYSTWMCHMPYTSSGNKSEFLDSVANSVAKIIADKSGRNGKTKKTVQQVLDMMSVKTYLSADQMYENGLVDRVLTSNGKIKKFDTEVNFKNNYIEYQRVFNKFIINNEIDKKMENVEKIVNHLKLAPGSGDTSIIAEIARRENEFNAMNRERESFAEQIKVLNQEKIDLNSRLSEMQSKAANAEAALNAKSTEYDEMKNKYDAMCSENESFKNREKEIAETTLKNQCKEFTAKLVETGRIKDDEQTVSNVEKALFKNFDETKLIFENLPVNMHVPKPKNQDGGEQSNEPRNVLDEYRIQNRQRIEKEEAEAEAAAKAAGVI